MSTRVVVLGAGYAGARAIHQLAATAPEAVDLRWISATPYHVVAHELHRLIRRPKAQSALQIPIDAVCPAGVHFQQGTVVGIDPENRQVELATNQTVSYDYLLVAIGSQVAFYDIPGVEAHAHTLKGTEAVLGINDQLKRVTAEEPGRVVIGGGGLSGIQAAGEIAAYGAETGRSFDITLIEAGDEIYPGQASEIQAALRRRLENRDVDIMTNTRVTAVSDTAVEVGDGRTVPYDVHIWAGGVTGQGPAGALSLATNNGRLVTDDTFQTEDDRIFAVGDSAWTTLDDHPLPPTAQAAWQTAPTAAANIVRTIGAEPRKQATYTDRGTAISIGDDALVHDVSMLPVDPLTGPAAAVVKKVIAARMIATLADVGYAARAWRYL